VFLFGAPCSSDYSCTRNQGVLRACLSRRSRCPDHRRSSFSSGRVGGSGYRASRSSAYERSASIGSQDIRHHRRFLGRTVGGGRPGSGRVRDTEHLLRHPFRHQGNRCRSSLDQIGVRQNLSGLRRMSGSVLPRDSGAGIPPGSAGNENRERGGDPAGDTSSEPLCDHVRGHRFTGKRQLRRRDRRSRGERQCDGDGRGHGSRADSDEVLLSDQHRVRRAVGRRARPAWRPGSGRYGS